MIRKLLLQMHSLFFNSLSQKSYTQNVKLLCLLMFFVVSFANAATRYSVATGNWNATATWSATSGGGAGASAPVAGDIVIIERGFTVHITANAACGSLQVGSPNNSNFGAIDFTGAFSIDVSGNSTFGGYGNTARTGTITFSNGSALNTGSLTLGNSLGTPGAGIINMTSGGTLKVAGAILVNTVAGNTWTPGAGTVILTANNTLPSTIFTTFNNLTINSGTTTMGVGLTINGNLNVGNGTTLNTTTNNFTLAVTGTTSISGTLTLANTGNKTFTGNATINSGGIWNETGVAAISFANNFQNDGTYTANTAVHTFSGTAKTISGSGTITIPSVSITGTYTNNNTLNVSSTLAGGGTLNNSTTGVLAINGASTITTLANAGITTINGAGNISTATANFTNTGTLNLNGSGTIAGITNNAGGTVNLANSGIITTFNNATATSQLNISASPVPTINTLTTTVAGNTVNYNGSGAQTLKTTTYSNLTLSGSSTKTFGAAITVTNLLSIATNTIANLGTFQHSAGILTLGGAGPLISTWGHTTSNPVAENTNDTFFASNTGRIQVTATPPGSAIDNNYASYGITGQVTGVTGEYDGGLTLTAPDGNVFINVKFASYGLPGGTSPNFTIGSCHAFNSRTVTTGLLGNTSATIPASGTFNYTFGDPCRGISKNYYVVATYAKPICSGTNPTIITGSDPSGGNGPYAFLWEVSTTSATSGYTTASGTSTGRDYTIPSAITQKTWYRRTVTSGIYSDPTIVVIPVNTISEITAPTTAGASSTSVCAGNPITLTASGGGFSTVGGYAEWTTGSCSGPVVGTSALANGALTITPTANATYYVKYKNSCGSTACASVSVSNPTSITLASSSYSTCFNPTIAQNASVSYSATTGTPTSFSIDWDAAANTAGIIDRTNIAYTFGATASTINNAIVIPANTPAGTYTGTLTVRTGTTCVSFGNIITVTVNALPTPTFTAQPGAPICIGTSVTYTTETGMSNYIWGFTGVAGTNYVIDSGGTTGTNTVTLHYLTAGSKTVTVNYTNSNGCTATAATSSSALTVNPNNTVTLSSAVATTNQTTCINTAVTNITYTTTGATGATFSGLPTGVSGVWAANVVTISGTPSAAGTFNYTVTLTGGCGTVNTTGTIIVTPVNTVTLSSVAATINQTTCVNSAITNITYTTTGATGATFSGLPAGVNGAWASNVVTISGTPSAPGTFNYNVTLTGGCGTVNTTGTITVNPLPTAPGVVATNISCTTTGSVTLSNLPAGSWTINQTGDAIATISGSGSTFVVSGLAVGTYRFTVNNGSCTSTVSTDAIITDQSSTTWDGTGWSNLPPNANKAAIITGPYTVTADLTACSLTINGTVNIVVPSDRTLNIVNGLTVSPTATLTFENHSSLVQKNDNPAINTGKISYKRIAPQIRQADYTYWSTPVSPQRLIDVSPLSPADKFYYYTTTGWKSIAPTNNMVVGKGYIIRGPGNYSNTAKLDYPAEFKGVPNNGALTGEFMAVPGKFYLIGNPYPSALSADAFIGQNPFLEGTLYFWTHNTPVVLTGAYRYSSTDYASYNLTGSVRTGTTAVSGNPSNPKERPTGFIGAGQSFFAAGTSAGTITFNNAMRFGGTDNTQFFKSAAKQAVLEKHRLWLNMTNTEGAFKQMLVGYVQGASNEYESKYDGLSFDANPYLDFYSVANGNDYVIQGRALPFTDTDLVPLGYRTTIAGEFTIAIDEADGNLKNQVVYLEDKTTNVIHDLTQSDYKFTTVKGTFADRFVLRYTNKTLGTGDFENIENGLLVSVKDKAIKVLSSKENIKEVTIYDVSGKLLYNKKKAATTELQIQNLQSANQVLLVKVTLENNFTTTKKIIFK